MDADGVLFTVIPGYDPGSLSGCLIMGEWARLGATFVPLPGAGS